MTTLVTLMTKSIEFAFMTNKSIEFAFMTGALRSNVH